MRRTANVFLAASSLFAGTLCHADFKYTQQSQVTGGSLVSMTKTLGVFSKNARQVTEPQLSTTMVKGGRMRQEHADGTVEIIDVEGKRFINIDTNKKTYTTMTFDEFKAAMQRAQERAKEEQAKQTEKHPEAANVKIVPKMHSEETGATKTILNLPTKEVKWRLDMEMQSTDPNAQAQAQAQGQAQSATMTLNSDSWIAESVPGYDEMQQFYIKMAKELNWLPGTMGSMVGMNSQMGSAMDEFRKNAIKVKGMPLLTTVSMGMGVSGMPADQAGQPAQQPAPAQPTSDSSSSVPTNTKDAITKGLGGMLGGFGKKKKQQQDQQASTDSTQTAGSNSLMDTTTQVTAYSSDTLDKSLFDVPAGYVQVPSNPDDPLSMRHQ
jgi:hypothetical protein